ncbi:LolA-like protein [Nocardiopsis valliformis]|uniref:hypothetical protein n=1 Tax=Nocardiopsis valliformis TaxID=239974 RepID=UPI00034854DF|nr:hypothetical protein [Nocardiopsis valliformis]
MQTRAPAVIAAASLSLALALTACGNDAAEEESTTEEAAEETSAEELLANLDSATDGIDNYTLEIESVALDPDLGDTSVKLEYLIMDDPAGAQMTAVMPSMGEFILDMLALSGSAPEGLTGEDLGTSTAIILEDQDVLLADPHGFQGSDTPWVRGETPEEAVDPTEDFDITAIIPAIGAFSGIEDVEEVGSEEIHGVETTVIEGVLTSEGIGALGEAEGETLANLVGGVLLDSMDAKLWLDADGFPMRIEFADAGSEGVMEFSDIGSTSFEIPSEDEITDL